MVWTKEQKKEYNCKYWKEHKEQGREYARKYKENNKAEMKEYNHKYWENNKAQIKEREKTYRQNNKDKIKEQYQNRKNVHPWISSYRHAKNRCTDLNNDRFHRYGGRGIKFLLIKEEVKQLWFRDRAFEMEQPSIDRKNNDGHYEFNNCQFMEMVENSRKGSN